MTIISMLLKKLKYKLFKKCDHVWVCSSIFCGHRVCICAICGEYRIEKVDAAEIESLLLHCDEVHDYLVNDIMMCYTCNNTNCPVKKMIVEECKNVWERFSWWYMLFGYEHDPCVRTVIEKAEKLYGIRIEYPCPNYEWCEFMRKHFQKLMTRDQAEKVGVRKVYNIDKGQWVTERYIPLAREWVCTDEETKTTTETLQECAEQTRQLLPQLLQHEFWNLKIRDTLNKCISEKLHEKKVLSQ